MVTRSEHDEKKIKVGIPRALHFYRYFPFWKKLLEELDTEIIISPLTNKEIVEEGVTHGFGELCIPMKIYYGQVIKLIKDHPDLDYIFVPGYVSEIKESYFCPKPLPSEVRLTYPPGTPRSSLIRSRSRRRICTLSLHGFSSLKELLPLSHSW